MQDASIPSGIKDHLLRRNEGVANNAKYPAKFHTLASLGRHAGGASFADAKDLFTSQERGYDQRCVLPNFILLRHVTGVQDVSTPAGIKRSSVPQERGCGHNCLERRCGLAPRGRLQKRRVCPQGSHPGAPLKR